MSEVAIVGGGPVGLFLALRLHDLGVTPSVLERRAGPHEGSRSIGVHPPSLEHLDALGLATPLAQRGVRVRLGRAFVAKRPVGELDFSHLPGPHAYVLSVPQQETEQLLRDALVQRVPGALRVGVEVLGIEQESDSVAVRVASSDGSEHVERHAFVVGCDGRHSTCREACGSRFVGQAYDGEYAMCDVQDVSDLGPIAAVFLDRDGLVESFPLPGDRRRWVARRRSTDDEATLDELLTAVERRAGVKLSSSDVLRWSAFRAERFMADRLAKGRVALAGDAAHVISPIGGQGMNVGWLGAWSLAETLARTLRCGSSTALERDGRRRSRSARAAGRRAELNMWLGRPGAGALRAQMITSLLRAPLHDLVARLFTMRGVDRGL